MIEEKIKNDTVWEKDFQKRLTGFLKKAPVMVVVQIKIHENKKGVMIKHSNTGLTYFFPFEYKNSTKDFIAEIKKVLFERHYPRLIEEIYLNRESTPEDIAIAVENNTKPEKYVVERIGTRTFVIDKVLLWKSIFILKIETSTFEEDEIGSSFRYKYNGSGMLFLKNYRNNKWQSLEGASQHFFENSLLVDQIIPKDDQD